MKTGKKVGILGGTFNPIHIGHLILAEQAYDEYKLDEILFIPTGISHFKDPNVVLDKKKRISMTGGAIDDNPHFALSTIETDRPGNSYTYETLEELKRVNPDTEYYLIVGAAFMPLFFVNNFVPDHLSLNRFLLFWFLFVIGTALITRGFLSYSARRRN